MGESKITVGICGASGFVGGHLSSWLAHGGYEVIPIGREQLNGEPDELERIVSGCDVVINLVGAPINKRWSVRYKALLRSSRIDVTRKIVDAINATNRTRLFISTSAIGIYRSDGVCSDEGSEPASDTFLSRLCGDWEAEAERVKAGVRLVITRFGVVMSDDGGAFVEMSRPYRVRVGVSLGRKSNSFSWIYIGDLVRILQLLIEDDTLNGVFNLTSPEPVSVGDMDRLMSRHYKVWFSVNIPEWIVRVLLGESVSALAGNLCVMPKRLISLKYSFQAPIFSDFLKCQFPYNPDSFD